MSKLSFLCLTGYPSFAIILHMKNRILLAHSAQYEEDGSVKIHEQSYASHINNVCKILQTNINQIKDNFIDLYEEVSDFEVLKQAFFRAVEFAAEYHDMGKLDNQCQRILRGELKDTKMLNHTDAGVAYLLKKYEETDNAIFIFSAVLIKAHHIALEDMENFIINTHDGFCKFVKEFNLEDMRDKKLCEKYKGISSKISVKEHVDKNLDSYVKKHRKVVKQIHSFDNIPHVDISSPLFKEFIFLKMGLSLLVAADHMDTASNYGEPTAYPTKIIDLEERQERLNEYMEEQRQKFPQDTERNKLRNGFYNICKDFSPQTPFSLVDGCVGIGKSTGNPQVAFNQAKTCNNPTGFIFVTPYIALNDQLGKVYRDCLCVNKNPEKEISVIHSIYEYDNKFMRRYAKEFNSPISIVTSVSFFNTLIKNKVSFIKNIHKFAGKTIVFDEHHIMAQKHHWKVIIQLLKDLARFFDVRIIFSSGTPVEFWEIDQVKNTTMQSKDFDHPESFLDYFEVEKVIDSKFRKKMVALEQKRVKQLFAGDLSASKLAKEVNKKNGSVLVVLETVNKCVNFAQMMSAYDKKVFVRHSRLTPNDRKKHIKKMQELMSNGEDVILVATPGGNVGLDLSFHHGFHDATNYDDSLQTGGRVSRNDEFPGATLTIFKLTEWNENPTNARSKSILFDEINMSKRLCPTKSTELSQKEYDEDEEVNRNIANKLLELNSFYCKGNYDKLSRDFRIIDSASINLLIDEETKDKIVNNDWVNYNKMQGHIVSVTDYGNRKLDDLIEAGKVVSIDELLEEEYGETLDGVKYKSYQTLYFWLGDYDPDIHGTIL